jgi:hypothetical protein
MTRSSINIEALKRSTELQMRRHCERCLETFNSPGDGPLSEKTFSKVVSGLLLQRVADKAEGTKALQIKVGGYIFD